MRKRTRFLSFILALIMTLSSVNLVAGETRKNNANSAGSSWNPSGSVSGGYTNASNGQTTGYKIQLVFLPVEGLKPSLPPEERQDLIDKAWNKATPDTAIKIGDPLYLTMPKNINGTSKGFRHTDFEYGLGTTSLLSSYNRAVTGTGDADRLDITVRTPDDINSGIANLHITSLGDSTKVKYSESAMHMSNDLPIKLGSAQNNANGSLKDYFMIAASDTDKKNDPGVDAEYYATPNFAGLVNYLATSGGQQSDKFIYFGRIKNSTNTAVEKYDSLIPNGANCFEAGLYNGVYGEYRLIVSDYWVLSRGVMPNTALTLRDFVWCYNQPKYKDVMVHQQSYVGGLGIALSLENDDIWGLKSGKSTSLWTGYSKDIASFVEQNYGGGLSFFTSAMMAANIGGEPNYIGSVVNVFLPGALSGSDNSIKTASVEYIGPRSSDATSSAMMSGLIQLSQAASGMTLDNNIFTNGQLSQDVLLNGTIKLPGINKSDATSDAALSVLRAILDGAEGRDDKITITEETRNAIKQTLKDELGIDLSATGSGTKTGVNMQDVSLAVYLLSRFQQTGLEANGNGYEVWDTPGNRWRQILAYEEMLANTKPKNTIETNESGAWSGPLGITANDLTQYTTNKNANFDTAGLGENRDALKNSTAPSTSEGAQQAISADVLDNKQIGQITASDNWGNILGGSTPADGLVRVPVAMGTTQVYLDSINEDSDSVNIGKNQLPSTVATVFADVLNGIRSTGKTDGSAQQISLKDSADKAYKDKGLATDGLSAWQANMLTDEDDIGSSSLQIHTGASGKRLFAPVVQGDSFGSSYSKQGESGSLMYNTFGLNALANVAVAATLDGLTPAGGATNNLPALNEKAKQSLIAVPSYAYYTAETTTGERIFWDSPLEGSYFFVHFLREQMLTQRGCRRWQGECN